MFNSLTKNSYPHGTWNHDGFQVRNLRLSRAPCSGEPWLHFQVRGFESSILQVNVTCYHVFLDGRKCHQPKIMINRNNPPTFNIPHPTSNLKNPWNKNQAEKKVVPLRRRLTSPLHQRNWSAWQSRAASAGLSAIKFISGFGSLPMGNP